MKRTSRSAFLILCILLLSAATGTAGVYRWTDDNGTVIFGDTPPKDKTATAVRIENTKKSGATFANPKQIKSFERYAAKPHRNKPKPKKKISTDCRRYISKLNKVEIFLEHTDSPRDQLKARDLRRLAKKYCGATRLTQKFSDSYCNRYQKNLNKTEIFLEHTSSPRDEQKAKDLKSQIARECG